MAALPSRRGTSVARRWGVRLAVPGLGGLRRGEPGGWNLKGRDRNPLAFSCCQPADHGNVAGKSSGAGGSSRRALGRLRNRKRDRVNRTGPTELGTATGQLANLMLTGPDAHGCAERLHPPPSKTSPLPGMYVFALAWSRSSDLALAGHKDAISPSQDGRPHSDALSQTSLYRVTSALSAALHTQYKPPGATIYTRRTRNVASPITSELPENFDRLPRQKHADHSAIPARTPMTVPAKS